MGERRWGGGGYDKGGGGGEFLIGIGGLLIEEGRGV